MKKINGIKGFIPLSLVDFPGIVSSVIFVGGCNLRCPFCHNMSLVLGKDSLPDIDLEKILCSIIDNREVVDGTVVTGGEPTIFAEIIPLLSELKRFGLKIKLDTNGMEPKAIKKIVLKDLVDYVAVDVKSSLGNYYLLGCEQGKQTNLISTIDFLKSQNKVKWELRTTYFEPFVSVNNIDEIKTIVDGAPNYYVQAPNSTSLVRAIGFVQLARNKFKVGNFGVRNVRGELV